MKRDLSSGHEWVNLVKQGRLDEALVIFVISHRAVWFFRFFHFRRTVALSSLLLSLILRRCEIEYDSSDDAVDLDSEFLVFWKKPDYTGILLIIKIVFFYIRYKKFPTRALIWFSHWLVFQGRFTEAQVLLSRADEIVLDGSRLKGELQSFLGNYYYSVGELEKSRRCHIRADQILKENNDDFFQLFNIGTSAKTYTDIGNIEDFKNAILLRYDSLNPTHADERYGMRVLIYASYLFYLNGQSNLGKQFLASAERCYLDSGSDLDKSVFCIYKSLIQIYVSDLDGARLTVKLARRNLGNYGKYEIYESQIEEIHKFLTKGGAKLSLIKNILTHERSIKQIELEAWYYQFLQKLLPTLESFGRENIFDFLSPLEEVTDSRVEITLVESEFSLETSINSEFAVYEDSVGLSRFELDIFHSGKKYKVSVSTSYQRWRNPEIYSCIKDTLHLIQKISRQDYLNMLTQKQQQKISEIDLSRRIAHDIKSPLAALKVALSNTNAQIQDLGFINASIQKIDDITNCLGMTKTSSRQAFLVKDLVNSIVSSKRLEYSSRQVALKLNYLNCSGSAFISINELEMSRTLSNIINNAIEASAESSVIDINIDKKSSYLMIDIVDRGQGIDESVIHRVFDKDVSFKCGGTGLGLYYAKKYIESVDGDISITSGLNSGCTVRIRLPLVLAPSPLMNRCVLVDRAAYIVIEDICPNYKIISEWLKKSGVEPICFKSIYEAEIDIRMNSRLDAIYIIDYVQEKSFGEVSEFISNHNLEGRSILVTFDYNNKDLIQWALRKNIFIIPKAVIEEVELITSKPCVVVVDDEKYFLNLLKIRLENKVDLRLFSNPLQAMESIQNIPISSMWFIDQYFDGRNSESRNLIESLKANNNKNLFSISAIDDFDKLSIFKLEKSDLIRAIGVF